MRSMLSDIFNKRNGRFVKFKFLITFELRKLSLYCNMYSTCKIVFHMFTLLCICVDWSTDLWALKINSVRTFVYRRSYHTHFSTFRDKYISIYVQQPRVLQGCFFFLNPKLTEANESGGWFCFSEYPWSRGLMTDLSRSPNMF